MDRFAYGLRISRICLRNFPVRLDGDLLTLSVLANSHITVSRLLLIAIKRLTFVHSCARRKEDLTNSSAVYCRVAYGVRVNVQEDVCRAIRNGIPVNVVLRRLEDHGLEQTSQVLSSAPYPNLVINVDRTRDLTRWDCGRGYFLRCFFGFGWCAGFYTGLRGGVVHTGVLGRFVCSYMF